MRFDICSPFTTATTTKENMSSATCNKNVLKYYILTLLCLQNAGYTLIRKYSTKTQSVSSKEILLVSEVIKIVISIWLTLTSSEVSDAEGKGLNKLVWLVQRSSKMLVLAFLYGIMNILSFVALAHIGAGEFTICAQLKILATAGFSVLILHTSLSWTKWRALFALVLGCILVASPSFSDQGNRATLLSQLFGYGAVLLEVVLSGFASIYFEKVIKSNSEVITIWERNFQLGIYSIVMYAGIIVYEASVRSSTSSSGALGFSWHLWTPLTVGVSVFGAVGGLLVAATLKYADSILKTLAAAGAIILSTLLGHLFLDGKMDLVVVIGTLSTILAICNYTFDSSSS